MKVVILSPFSRHTVRSLLVEFLGKNSSSPDIFQPSEATKELLKDEAVVRELQDADVILGDYTKKIRIDSELLGITKKLKFIQQPDPDYSNIDLNACNDRGITVANIPHVDAISTSEAEHIVAIALVLMKHIFYAHLRMLDNRWARSEVVNASSNLKGKNWGMIGINETAIQVAKRVKAMGARVLYHNKQRMSEREEKSLNARFKELNSLLVESDILSIHSDKSDSLIGEEQLRLMKPNAVLINTSSPNQVDEMALARALMDGWIMGAGVDTYSQEPPGPDDPLLLAAKEGAPIILTPHIAGDNSDSRFALMVEAVKNIARFLKGEQPRYIVTE